MRLIHPSSFLPSNEGCHPDKWAENRNILVNTSTGNAQAEVFEFLCFFARAMKDFISLCTTLSSLSSVCRRSVLSISRPSPASKRERMNVLHASLARFVVRVLYREGVWMYTHTTSRSEVSRWSADMTVRAKVTQRVLVSKSVVNQGSSFCH